MVETSLPGVRSDPGKVGSHIPLNVCIVYPLPGKVVFYHPQEPLLRCLRIGPTVLPRAEHPSQRTFAARTSSTPLALLVIGWRVPAVPAPPRPKLLYVVSSLHRVTSYPLCSVSHRNLCCRGCLSMRGLDGTSQDLPGVLPTHFHPAARTLVPLSVDRVYVMTFRYPIALAALQQAPYSIEQAFGLPTSTATRVTSTVHESSSRLDMGRPTIATPTTSPSQLTAIAKRPP